MYRRWYYVAVIGLWLTSMTWLVSQKVLPPILQGEPPSAREVFEAQKRQPVVAWELMLDGRPLGWALSTVIDSPHDLTEIRSRVHIDRLPLERFTDGWVGAMMSLVKRQTDVNMLQVDTENTVAVDLLGNLVRFDSTIKVGPKQKLARIEGVVHGDSLLLTVEAGDHKLGPKEYPVSDALLGNSFAPDTQLPKLHDGQTWTVRTYNPLKPFSPLEIIEAKVEGSELLAWNGRHPLVWRVVFRRDSGSGLIDGDRVRGQLWVTRDGTVLKQEVVILDATLTFSRLTDDEAVRLEKAAAETPSGNISLDRLLQGSASNDSADPPDDNDTPVTPTLP